MAGTDIVSAGRQRTRVVQRSPPRSYRADIRKREITPCWYREHRGDRVASASGIQGQIASVGIRKREIMPRRYREHRRAHVVSSSGKRDQRKKLRSIRQKPIDIQESVRTVQIISDEARLAKTKKGSSEDEPLKQDGGTTAEQRQRDVRCLPLRKPS